MSDSVTVKRDNVGLVFSGTFTAADGTAIPLDAATEILFVMWSRDDTLIRTATADPEVPGGATYTTVDGDLPTADVYRQVWRATFVDGRVLTAPSEGYNFVEVEDVPDTDAASA